MNTKPAAGKDVTQKGERYLMSFSTVTNLLKRTSNLNSRRVHHEIVSGNTGLGINAF